MKITPDKLKNLLLEANLISEEQFNSAKIKAEKKNIPLDDYLVENDIVSDVHLGQIIAVHLRVPFVDFDKEPIQDDVLHLIPEVVANSRGVIAFSMSDKGIKVGMLDPADLTIKHIIEKRVGQNIIPYYITKKDFKNALDRYRIGLKKEFDELLKQLKDESLPREQKDELTIKMVDSLLLYGYQNRSSDIHIEPQRKKVVVRFRIDGVLHNVLDIDKGLYDSILMRIKILSKLRIDEHRAAQDGKFRFDTKEEKIDVRVSVVPVTEGENVVMRLLSEKSRRFSLENLGLSGGDYKKVEKAIKNPYGMILATGPTGSGKTTTLYAILKILNKPEVNIATIEDPVEYDIEGVSQIQVNLRTNLTFAKGLRSIIRQDPDIIMVGEIRDEETAGIAVNSAMTGHLVLSTLHTNDAATTLPRLLDMGIEPFLVASTANIAVAQRLVRKNCQKCRASYNLTDQEKKVIMRDAHLLEILEKKGHKKLENLRLYKGDGCKLCGNSGYIGRIGIFEVLEMDDSIKDLIIKRAASGEIMKTAVANGMTTMLEDGIDKVLKGETTLEEILRVIRE